MSKEIQNIILHCSDSAWGCTREIRKWHLERGWKDIGYQFVVLNGRPVANMDRPFEFLDGTIECGRYLDGDNLIAVGEVGAHALGLNDRSVGICMIGRGSEDFTTAQWESTIKLIISLCVRYGIPLESALGHYETENAGGKTCPNIKMPAFREVIEYTTHKQGRPI
jgi:hypothetical protein